MNSPAHKLVVALANEAGHDVKTPSISVSVATLKEATRHLSVGIHYFDEAVKASLANDDIAAQYAIRLAQASIAGVKRAWRRE